MKRKHLLLTLLLAMLAPWAANVQAQNVFSYGENAAQCSADASPFGGYYNYEYKVFLYDAAEVDFSGIVSALTFKLYEDYAANSNVSYTWYMKDVPSGTTLSLSTTFAEFTNGLTPILDCQGAPAMSQGWNTVTLTNTFEHQSGNSILFMTRAVSSERYVGRATYFINNSEHVWFTTEFGHDPGTSVSGDELRMRVPAVKFTYTPFVAVGDYWNDDFEGSSCGWDFVNGTQPNQWVWGTATNNGGSKALYISNDGGATNDYTNNSPSVVYATKQFSFAQSGYYRFEYDWKNNGEGETGPFDRLRVALVPGLPELTPGTEFPGLDSQNLPSGWIALDGGHWLSGYEVWQNANEEAYIEAGTYTMVFVWRNDSSGGWGPAAIDNVNILSRRAPFDLACSHKSSNAVTIAWTSGAENQTNWQVVYSEDPNFDPNSATDIISTQAPEVRLEGLIALDTYYVYVRGNCGSGFSDWSERFEFTTEAICDQATGLQVVEGSQTCQGATIQWNDNGDDFTVMAGEMNFTNYYLFDFLGEQFPADFTHSDPNYGFVKANDEAYDNRDCAKSNNGGHHNTTAEMVLNVTIPIESDLSFAARVSSEQDYDKAYFSIDGTVQEQLNGISGEGQWYGYGFTLPAGSHTLRWYYVKDTSYDRNDDCFYITDISISSYVVDEWLSYEHATSPYTITGLATNTDYYVKVIRNCTPDNHSSDGYIAGFRTLPCQAPTDLEVIAVTTEYFQFQYCGLEGGVYQYAIDKADSEPHWYNGNISSPQIVDGCPSVGYSLIGFEPNTDYIIRVRRICGEDDYSESATATFHTLDQCAAIPTLGFNYSPYSWNFEDVEGINLGDNPTENNLPMCWDYINTSSDETMKYYPVVSYSNQNNFLFFSSMYAVGGCVDPQPQYALLPPVEDVSILKMSFRAKTITNFRGTFSVGVMEGTDVSTFEEIVSFDPSASFQDYTVTFENYNGSGKRIAIMGVAADDSHRRTAVSIDDIVLELNCVAPKDLAVSNVTVSTADLSWTGSPAAESYTVRYREINAGTPTFTEGFENGLGDWVFYSANQANDIGGTNENHAGIFPEAAHSGDYGFRFSSYYSANQGEDYWQYLTSPEFELSGPSTLSFYYKKLQEYAESLYVGYIDSNNEIIYTSQDIHPTQDWQLYVLDLPVEAKKVFFSYYGDYIWYVYLDDISISPASPWIEVTNITSTNSTLSGLSLNTEYQVQVKGNCSINDWSDAVTFTTQSCTYPVPSTWDFEDVAEAHLPSCWTRMGSISTWPKVNTYFAYSGSRDLEFYHASANDETFIAVMPDFAADLNTLSVEFYGKQPYGDEPAYIEAGYMTDLDDVASFVNAKTFYMTNTYEKYTAFFNNAPTDGFIAFRTTYLNQPFAIVIDDVTVKEIECEVVTNLEVTETGPDYVVLDWEGQEGADFHIFYINQTTQESLYTVATQTPFTLGNLASNTTYTIKVTPECNVVNTNPYDQSLVATTQATTAPCIPPTDLAVSNVTANSADLSWTGLPAADSYTVAYRTVAVAGDTPLVEQGFENGMGDWFIGQEYIGGTTCAGIVAEAARNGDYGFKLAACEGTYTEGQSSDALLFATAAIDQPTILKFYYKKGSSSSLAQLVFMTYSDEFGYFTQYLFPTDDWQSYAVVLPADVQGFEIDYLPLSDNPSSSVFIDDITISPVAQAEGEWQYVENIEATSHTLTDLTVNTEYEVKVLSDCYDSWIFMLAPSVFFTTACGAVVDLTHPFTEGFEQWTFPPQCWESIPHGDYHWEPSTPTYNSYHHTGGFSAYSGFYGPVYLVMPDIQISNDVAGAQLSFWSFFRSTDYYDKSSVVLIDGETETELWTPNAETIGDLEDQWVESIVDLSEYVGQTIKLAFKQEGNDAHGWFVDDVTISASNISLSAGWNWWTPVEQVTAAQLDAALNGHLQRIVSKTAEINLASTTDLVPGQMYKLQTDADVMGNVSGTAVPIGVTIGNGTNWIGYAGENAEIATALNTLGITPANGDKIVSQDGGFAIYVDGSGWHGTLAALVKGQGYLYIR